MVIFHSYVSLPEGNGTRLLVNPRVRLTPLVGEGEAVVDPSTIGVGTPVGSEGLLTNQQGFIWIC